MSYRCQACSFSSPRWMGFCPQCSVGEPLVGQEPDTGTSGREATVTSLSDLNGSGHPRVPVGLGEFDRVLGGGIVAGSVSLLGGEPGVGKSTLLLQAAAQLACRGRPVLIASAEESEEQIGLRARRLGIDTPHLYFTAEHDIEAVLAAASRLQPNVVVIDSIQTFRAPELGGPPGGVPQVRECAARAARFAKDRGVATLLIGHVTKDGELAGPKLLEHMVDVVLSLEGDSDHGLRVLRCLKNRFGPGHLTALYEMSAGGLSEVPDPSQVFVADWDGSVAGSVVFPTIDGRRSVLVEIQALVSKSRTPSPRRSVRGLDQARVHQILAVLDRHAGIELQEHETYVTVVGGLRVAETAADLPVALALVSSYLDRPLGRVAAWGEVGLTGELRRVPHTGRRREEAQRMGIEKTIVANGEGPRRMLEALATAGLLHTLSWVDGDE